MADSNLDPRFLRYVPVAVSPEDAARALPVAISGLPVAGGIPTGDPRQVVGYDEEGNPIAVTLSWAQLSDQPDPPDFSNGVLTMARMPGGDDQFGLVELSLDEDLDSAVIPNAIPVYQNGIGGGQLPVAAPILDTHAATKKYVDDAIAAALRPPV